MPLADGLTASETATVCISDPTAGVGRKEMRNFHGTSYALPIRLRAPTRNVGCLLASKPPGRASSMECNEHIRALVSLLSDDSPLQWEDGLNPMSNPKLVDEWKPMYRYSLLHASSYICSPACTPSALPVYHFSFRSSSSCFCKASSS
jgi:hypothetical protein